MNIEKLSGGVPSPNEAKHLLNEAGLLNPGKWVNHSLYVGAAAQLLAMELNIADPETAYSLGILHDIGRRTGSKGIGHIIEGWRYLESLGYGLAARIAMTHSFPIPDVETYGGIRDVSAADLEMIADYLKNIEMNDLDRLIQLCDVLAMPDGFCLMEKRMVDAAVRHGVTPFTPSKWLSFFQIRDDFEARMGKSIYSLLPGVMENTFCRD